jgi:hypothetical protein
MTSQNIDLFSWDILYFSCKMQRSGEEKVNSGFDFARNKTLIKINIERL